ncbi:ABC transporter ATP-binding protein [Actinotalea solisilvae]|uniref:ABC transporter ATP-binding protein n=1 Tax=Actinotalea solisilvae TaxID=2072922 RepID=UPI0027DCCA60|nr:ABC transporter ATP-binding protein [Actinotalea solisilvae]
MVTEHAAPAGAGVVPRATLLELRAVRRAFGDVPAVDGVDLTVRAGEIHALVGLNGAGKTTLMRLALGMLRPADGRALVAVDDAGAVDAWRAPPRVWRGVGHLVETPFAYPELTVRETVVAAARLRGLAPHPAQRAAEDVVAELALGQWADRRATTLSLGNRQRLGLACAWVHRPRLLVLDEPTTGLDPSGVLVVRRWLASTAAAGTGVLVSSHHLDEVARLADRITVVHRGRVIGGLEPHGADLERAFFAMVYAAEGLEAAR